MRYPRSSQDRRRLGGVDPTQAHLLIRLAVQTTIWLAIVGAILLLAAGDGRWPQAWIFLAETAVTSFAVCIWLAEHDPALLAERLTLPVHRNQQPWDRIFMALALATFVLWIVFLGLDARRFRWSELPAWAQALGALSIAASMLLVWQTFRFNTFAVPQARIQAERGHRVVSDGPYRFVRHPMYAGAVLFYLGMPLLLGSAWGLVPVPLFAAGMGARAVGEERMLRRELDGYGAYACKVRYRMLPGVW